MGGIDGLLLFVGRALGAFVIWLFMLFLNKKFEKAFHGGTIVTSPVVRGIK